MAKLYKFHRMLNSNQSALCRLLAQQNTFYWRKMFDLPDYVHDLLHKIAKAEYFTGDYHINVKPGCDEGDGFLGVIASVNITGTRAPNNDALHLVCKLAPTSAARREGFGSIALFKREAYMYQTVLPQLAAFEREKGLTEANRFTAYPKCYEIIADEEKDQFVLIMEDMRAKGYTMWDRSQPIPVNYVNSVLQQLARMHAISFALKDQRPKIYAGFKAVTDIVVDFMKTSTMKVVIEASYVRCLNAAEEEKHIEIIKDISANNNEYYAECVTDEFVGPYAVITHGDCWINNLLFHNRNEAGSPVDICMVDWQMSRFGSVIMDLHYIMFTSIDKTVLRNEYKAIMDYYHATLCESIRQLGSDPTQLYPYDVFTNDLKKFRKYAVLMALEMAQVMVAKKEDLTNLDEISERTDGSADYVQSINGITEMKYKQRIRDILDTFLQLNFC